MKYSWQKKLLILHYLWKETLDYTAIGTDRKDKRRAERARTCFTISQWVEIIFCRSIQNILTTHFFNFRTQFEYFMNKL